MHLLDHAVLGAHDLDLVRVVVELAGRRLEETVHDGGVGHEVSPEADGQRLDDLLVGLSLLRLLQQIAR